MIGKYYKTLERDEATGETIFEFAPMEYCPYASDGILKCRGRIGVYAYGMPLDINGEFRFPYYEIQTCRFFSETKKSVQLMLEYLYPDLTEAQESIILEKCKNNILNLAKEPEILDEALKRSKSKDLIKKEILKKLKRFYEHEKLTSILMKYNVELNKIENLCSHNISYEQFVKNPYLCSLYHAISIYQADQFAYEVCKIEEYSTKRMCGFMMSALFAYKQSGHSGVKFYDLLSYINSQLKKSTYPESQMNVAILNYCISLMSHVISYRKINDEVYVYENEIWNQEEQIVFDIKRLNTDRIQLIGNPDISSIETKLGITYNYEQRESFRLLETSGIKILTGPPGSGKTATLRGLMEAYKTEFPKRIIKLAATTGRAAQVMTESTGQESETINKMIDVRPFGEKYQGRNQNNPVEADFIICDEISMLGTELASLLFRAIKSGTLILLVGDEDQLQSVEYGNFLQDLIKSEVVETYRLKEIIRNSGAICENGQKINHGINQLTEDTTFYVHKCSETDAMKILLSELQKHDVQILSSVKQGELGIHNINQVVQKRRNLKKKLCLKYRKVEFYENDPIIMTQTDYDKGYFNGDIGIIEKSDENGVYVDFNGKILHLGKHDYHLMMLAYAITTHKSQGSSFENIHIVLPRQPENMLTRRILYTAVTRAKSSVHIYDIDHAMDYAIGNKAERPRLSLLCYKLKNM